MSRSAFQRDRAGEVPINTADIEVFYWTDEDCEEYEEEGFSLPSFDMAEQDPLNTEQWAKLERRKKAHAANFLANMGTAGKNRLKELIQKYPDKTRAKRLQNALEIEYFRQYRGDAKLPFFYRVQSRATYKTPSWEGFSQPTPKSAYRQEKEEGEEDLPDYEEESDDSEPKALDIERQKVARRRARRDEFEEKQQAALARRRRKEQEEQQKKAKFLATKFLSLGRADSKWVGQKVLGEGGSGIAGLWKYEDPRHPDNGKLMVVKADLRGHDLSEEQELLRIMGTTKSTHITALLRVAEPGKTPNNDEHIVPHIYMEYLPGGDVSGLRKRQLHKKEQLSERTLWEIFICLMKGVAAMNTGTENPVSHADGLKLTSLNYYCRNPNRPRPRDMYWWRPYVHHDLKPGNVLLGLRDQDEHKTTRIFKIADFGLAQTYGERGYEGPTPMEKRHYRLAMTPGWSLPEQFTARWEYPGWETDRVAGHYVPASNIWHVGAIMYSLLTFEMVTPFPGYRSFRSELLSSNITYGKHLETAEDMKHYSSTLRNLILECLIEKPEQRPLETDILNRIKQALKAAPPHLPGLAGERYDMGGPGEEKYVWPPRPPHRVPPNPILQLRAENAPNPRKRPAAAMAPNESFTSYLNNTDGRGQDFIGQERWRLFGGGGGKRMKWTEDREDLNVEGGQERRVMGAEEEERMKVAQVQRMVGWRVSSGECRDALRGARGDVMQAVDGLLQDWHERVSAHRRG